MQLQVVTSYKLWTCTDRIETVCYSSQLSCKEHAIPACNTGLGSFTLSIATISFCSSTGSIRKDSLQTLHSMDTTQLVKQEMNSPFEATIHSYIHSIQVSSFSSFTSSSCICGRTYTTFVCVYGICFWHHSYLLSCWLIVITNSLFPSQLLSFKAAPFDNELLCAW